MGVTKPAPTAPGEKRPRPHAKGQALACCSGLFGFTQGEIVQIEAVAVGVLEADDMLPCG